MNRLEKALFTLAAVAMLGWIGTSTAAAQGVAFQSTSLPRQVRAEGQTETVGEVVLTANSAGTIKSGSTISLNYGVAVEPGTGVVTCGAATCALGVNFTVGIAGSTATITFTTDVAFAGGDPIIISQIRLDASAAGTGPVVAFLAFVPASFPSVVWKTRRNEGQEVLPRVPKEPREPKEPKEPKRSG